MFWCWISEISELLLIRDGRLSLSSCFFLYQSRYKPWDVPPSDFFEMITKEIFRFPNLIVYLVLFYLRRCTGISGNIISTANAWETYWGSILSNELKWVHVCVWQSVCVCACVCVCVFCRWQSLTMLEIGVLSQSINNLTVSTNTQKLLVMSRAADSLRLAAVQGSDRSSSCSDGKRMRSENSWLHNILPEQGQNRHGH